MHTAKHLLEAAMDNGAVSYASDYAEPGYSLRPEQKGILFANWNDRSHYDHNTNQRIVDDNTMPRLAKVFEHAGYEIEWSDEWTTCCDCGKAVRTSPDSYSWKRSYAELNSDIVCAECVEPVEYLENLEGNANSAVTFDIDPADHGYVLVKDDMEHGWHPGQSDSPNVVAKSLRAKGVTRFLFKIDSVGQFDTSFSVFVHADEAHLVIVPPASALPYDPGTEMGKALRGEHSNHYRMETRTITPEEFISGSWLKKD